jgi:hypothetical protein
MTMNNILDESMEKRFPDPEFDRAIDNAMYETREKEMELERKNYIEQDCELHQEWIKNLLTKLARKHGL